MEAGRGWMSVSPEVDFLRMYIEQYATIQEYI